MKAPRNGPSTMEEPSLDSEEDVALAELADRFRSSAPLTALEEALSDAGGQADLLAILSHRLAGRPTPQTWADVADALRNYLGVSDPTAVEPPEILTLAAVDPDSKLPLLDRLLSDRPNVRTFLRRAVASYEPEIVAAYEAFGEAPSDWRVIRPRVLQDVTRDQLHIELRIEKYDGDIAFLEGTPTSILKLTRTLLRTLGSVPTFEAFETDATSAFLEEANDLVRRLQEHLDGSRLKDDPSPQPATPPEPAPHET
jgi:hypothetical protein